MSTEQQPSNAIVVLGRGINQAGEFSIQSRQRTEEAVRLYEDGVAPKLIASGNYCILAKEAPPRSEAEAMAELAAEKGVPKEDILQERRSRDTIGNIVLTAMMIEPYGWDKLAFVASDAHSPRVRGIVRVALGDIYSPSFFATKEREEGLAIWPKEYFLYAIDKLFLRGITAGDYKAIYERMARSHPAYNGSEITKRTIVAATIKALFRNNR